MNNNFLRNRNFWRFTLLVFVVLAIVFAYPIKRYCDQNAAKKAMEKDGAIFERFIIEALYTNDLQRVGVWWQNITAPYCSIIIVDDCVLVQSEMEGRSLD